MKLTTQFPPEIYEGLGLSGARAIKNSWLLEKPPYCGHSKCELVVTPLRFGLIAVSLMMF